MSAPNPKFCLNGIHESDITDPGATERVWATLPKSLIAEIDDFHHGKRMRNRSVAVAELIRIGLQSQGWRKAKPDA